LPALRDFEAMDLIHEQMRKKTENGLVKIEPLIKKQLKSLYYDRKISMYLLNKEKKIQDNKDLEKLIKKTQKPVNSQSLEEEELKKLISNYNINIKGMKLPYSSKIK
jgi:D-ribose pyranose/furanose isomerase RbsD